VGGVAKGAVGFDGLMLRFLEEEGRGWAEVERVVRERFGFAFEEEAMFASGLDDRGRFDDDWKDSESEKYCMSERSLRLLSWVVEGEGHRRCRLRERDRLDGKD
jgi:hypothetical protein